MMIQPVRSFCSSAAAWLLAFAVVCQAQAETIDFDDLRQDDWYDGGLTMVTGGVPVGVEGFVLCPLSGSCDESGRQGVSVETAKFPGQGYDVDLFNALLRFGFETGVNEVSFDFTMPVIYGNYTRLVINGQAFDAYSPYEFAGASSIPGIAITLADPQPAYFGGPVVGVTTGRLVITGEITDFAVGGGMVSLDNVHATPVPEPASALLLGVGAVAARRIRGRHRRERTEP